MSEQFVEPASILQHLQVGVAILHCSDFSVRYVNPYLHALLDEPWRSQAVANRQLDELLPVDVLRQLLPALRSVCTHGQKRSWQDIPYEGFLEVRGRTYWRVSLERTEEQNVLITLEDMTEQVRSRIYLHAIQQISAAIAGPFALPQVLDRILEAVQEMIGSTRCAVLLIDSPESNGETPLTATGTPATVTIAAQKGMYQRGWEERAWQEWHPAVSEALLLGHALRDQQTLVITDTSHVPEMNFPLLDDGGKPRRPGSALCIPIFEPTPDRLTARGYLFAPPAERKPQTRALLGSIEVYHRRARGFPLEEVELLEQFAQQAGLAIQNARLFLHINRLAQDASRNARQRQIVMHAIPDGVIIYDPRWRIADANPAIRQLLGWTDNVIGKHITEAFSSSSAILPPGVLAPLSRPDLEAELDRRMHEKCVDEFKLVGADGKVYTIRRSYASIHDELGDIFASVVVYHDVTEQAAARERIEAEVITRTKELAQRNLALQLAKAAQEQASARMALLLERLPSAVLLISAADKRIAIINRLAVQILQRIGVPLEPLDNPEEAMQRAINMQTEEALRPVVAYGPSGARIPYEERPFSLALRKGEASEQELHIQQTDGQMLFLLVNAAPVRTSEGAIASVILVLHEITRLKLLERARDDFFTTMAHEIKTPLANIRAHLSALQARDLQWPMEEQYAYLKTADEQVERLVRMVNQFLDASRIEAGALRLALEPILLPEMFEDLSERLEPLISSSERSLEIHLPSAVPAVLGDYELLMSVLINLLSNAFQYAPRGDAIHLEVETITPPTVTQPTSVEIRVRDRGPGMTQKQQAELFTRFSTFAAMSRPALERPGQPAPERRRGRARWSPSTGLGLYISRGIIEAHGSKLTLKSSPGSGASFAFVLAVAQTRELQEQDS